MTTPLLIILSIVLIIVGFILALLVTPLLGLDNKPPKAELTQEEDPEVLMGKPQSLAAVRSYSQCTQNTAPRRARIT